MTKQMQLDTDDIRAIAAVIEALQNVNNRSIKVRSLVFDIQYPYSHDLAARIKLTGERSRYGRSINVSKVDKPE